MLKKIIYMSMMLVSILSSATVNTDKENYTSNQIIVVSYADMQAQSSEWIAIYPGGSSNDFGNIVQWKRTAANVEGSIIFDSLALGTYDVRIFNSANFLVSKQITVSDEPIAVNPTVNTDKDTYASDESIVVSYLGMQAQSSEWIAIYPGGSSNDFGNILQWKRTNTDIEGSVTFDALTIGTYDVRIFNSSDFLVSKQIVVKDAVVIASVETTQDLYLADEQIVAVFDNMSGNADDWIGIYPVGSTNDWDNALQWEFIEDGLRSGTQTFEAIPAGAYEVRVFFNNSLNTEASYAFNVEALVLNIEVRKDIYDPYELIHVDFQNMRGADTDWIGLFAVGANNTKESAIEWRDTKSLVNGELSFNGLPSGNYEARAYFADMHQKTLTFTVQDKVATRILYDDFEDGIDPRWVRYFGRDMTLLNVGVNDGAVGNTERHVQINGQHSLRTYNSDGLAQSSAYLFDFQNPDPKLKFLEIDMKIGVSSHRFAFGAKIKTKFGNRRIEFASWYNHTLTNGRQIIRGPYGNVLEGHKQAATVDNYLHVHPSPSDYYVATSGVGAGWGMFVHYKINLEEALRVIEPDNEFLGVIYFSTSGGDYDNLVLTTH